MLSFEPGNTPLHRLDPRSKLAFQVGFAIAALAHTAPLALAGFTVLVVGALRLGGVGVRSAVYTYRYALVFLVPAPLIAGVTLGPPWFDLADAEETARASYRVFLIVLVSAAYVSTTTSRDSRAAIQRTVPGKPGQLLGMGVSLVFRFLPVLVADLRRIRDASRTRLGDTRGVVERGTHLGAQGLSRAFGRADRLSLAMQARCFAWNPTLPQLAMGPWDWLVVALAVGLGLTALL